jgi:hypothetical protein
MYTWSGGRKYEGQWKEGKRCGTGKLTVAAGFEYYGEFANDEFNGKGSL